jgi:hypothetical protein
LSHGVDLSELRIAVGIGRQAWAGLAPRRPTAIPEVKLQSDLCEGTADIVTVIGQPPNHTAILIDDWKTGHGTDRHRRQLEGYAYCAVHELGMPASGYVSISEIWIVHRRIERWRIDGAKLEAFARRLRSILKAAESGAPMEYRAGSHCRFCPHRIDCEARRRWLVDAASALVAFDPATAITPAFLGELYERAQEVNRAVRQYWAAVDSALDEGAIPLPDGRFVRRVESKRTKVAAVPALELLTERLGKAGAAKVVGDISKTELEEAIRATVEKGQGAAAIREIYGRLKGAGAVREIAWRERKVVDK